MPHCFIHIRTPNEVDRDKAGIECASLEAARAYVAQAARDYVNTADDLNLELLATSSFEIVNDKGRRELVLRFSEALPEPIKL